MTTSPPRAARSARQRAAVPTAHPIDERGAGTMTSARISLGRVFQAESANYFLLLGVTLFMVAFGLMMVLSSSAVVSHVDDNNFFARFLSQGVYAAIGVPLMLVVSRVPARFWQKWAWLGLGVACFLQALVVFTPLGVLINQNKNWLKIGPVVFQPSEAIKIALVLWLGMFLLKKRDKIGQWRHSVIPAALVSGVAIGLVMLGGDLGTTVIMAMMVVGALFFAGTPIRHLIMYVLVAGSAAVVIALSRPSRVDRILAFFQPHKADPTDSGYQIQQGMFALANGGIFGVGLGNSRSKWSWLPASSTDFIFAITGEELGLIGAILVLALFVLLAFSFCRIITAATDPFARVVTGTVLVWLLGQGLVNIAVVLGLLPVLGVPLPLISAGGTALISTLFAIGVVLSFARNQKVRR
ncbi:putative lipid II flippase FtsW [Rathayibacter soli]|uniref:putative lipid II flippase FtsW n=1 Tax=Rathayibacter soli TaxID=3144168 RepID=UPI0027E47200|nr:putative lipid II flippase FtsW [Glaciibacter superstes]